MSDRERLETLELLVRVWNESENLRGKDLTASVNINKIVGRVLADLARDPVYYVESADAIDPRSPNTWRS